MTIKVEVYHDGDVWCARGVEYDIFTCAKSLDKLVKGIQEAACCHFSGKVKKGTKIKIIIHTETDAHSIAKTAPNKR